LETRRFLMGDAITEVDVRLFTTLVRFDAVYHGHFKCNRNKLTESPVLWAYARDLYQTPGFGETVELRPHQAPLLRDARHHQPDGHRAGRAPTRPAGRRLRSRMTN
jgi:glutathionyl-hydroquinone reductase